MSDTFSTTAAILTRWIDLHIRLNKGIPLLFISGAQGIGKSTALEDVSQRFAGRVATLGIDDFYLTKAERAELARTVDPLFEVRGPAGTHDLKLLNKTIDALLSANADTQTPLPVFDKRVDDRLPVGEWRTFDGRPEAILLEGWCIGAAPASDGEDQTPLNPVEARDATGAWRDRQEAELSGAYAALWDRADAFLHLSAPSFEQVMDWRIEQEETTLGLARGTLPADRKTWVGEFIQYYQRVTERMLSGGRRSGYDIPICSDRSLVEPDRPAVPLIVFSDLDGTLLDHETYSFEAAQEALTRLRDMGAVLVLASSKTAAEIEPLRAEMDFALCPAIVENGSGILQPSGSNNTNAEARHQDIMAALNTLPPELRACFSGFSDWSLETLIETTGLSPSAAKRAQTRQYSEPGIWSGSDEELEAFKHHLTQHGISAQRGGRFLTLSHGKTKADQMFAIASRYLPAPMIALGDAPNDSAMLQAAHRGVIIKNANGPDLDQMKGEASGKIIRTQAEGPEGWNCAMLDFIAELDTIQARKKDKDFG